MGPLDLQVFLLPQVCCHILLAKYHAFNTLPYRVRVVCTGHSALKEEQNYTRQAPLRCNNPSQALNRLQTKIDHKVSSNLAHVTDSRHPTNNNYSNNHNIFLVVAYTRGLNDSFRKVYNKIGIEVHFRGNNTIHNLLVAQRTRTPSCKRVR